MEAVAVIAAERTAKHLGISDCGERSCAPARAEALAECKPRARPIRLARSGDSPITTLTTASAHEAAKCCSKLTPIVDILPAKQNEVLLENGCDVSLRKLLPDRAAVLVIHNAARLVQHLPAALPSQEAEIGVFEIKRMEQGIKAAKLQELLTIEGEDPPPP